MAKNIYVNPEETVVTNGTAQAPIPQVPIPKITYAQGGVATVTGQPTNYGNLMGGGNTPSPTPSTTYAANGFGTDMSNATLPEYYKYAYDVGVQNAERTRYNDIQNARVTYNQFINPYGAVANQQAQAGFTGGGYSQFLQGQAYQSMIDSQNAARAKEAATKQTLYGDYLEGMAKYNQAEKDKQEQNAVAAADLLNNIGTYTSLEAVNSALDALGITDAAQRETYINAWNTAQTTKQAQAVLSLNNYIEGNSEDGVPTSENDIRNYATALGITDTTKIQKAIDSWNKSQYASSYENINTEEGWNEFFSKGANTDGSGGMFKGLSSEQQQEAIDFYTAWYAQNNNYLDENGVYANNFFTKNGSQIRNDDGTAKMLLDAVQKNTRLSQEFKDSVQAEYEKRYLGGKTEETVATIGSAQGYAKKLGVTVKDDAKIVDIKSSTFASKDFGEFNDTGKKDSGQETYLSKIIEDAKNEKIDVGSLVSVNYGKYKNNGRDNLYMFVGNGQFVKVDENIWKGNVGDIYVPDGYQIYTNLGTTKDNERFGRIVEE